MCCLLIKRIAELSQAERSEAQRAKRVTVSRAKRGPPPPPKAVPPKAARPAGDEATELEANKHGANQLLWEAGKRALHVRDIKILAE